MPSGCFGNLLNIVLALLTAGSVYTANQKRGDVQLPDTPEPRPAPPLSDGVAMLYTLAVIALVVGGVFFLTHLHAIEYILLLVPGYLLLVTARVLRTGEQQHYVEVAVKPTLAATSIDRFAITLPRRTAWQSEVARRFVEHLARAVPNAALRIVAGDGAITWEVLDWRTHASPETVMEIIRTYYPDADITHKTTPLAAPAYPFYRYVLCFQHAAAFVWPIRPVNDLSAFDPLSALAQTLSSLRPGERVVYTLALSGAAGYAREEGKKLITRAPRIHPVQFMSIWGKVFALTELVRGGQREARYHASDQRVARDKLNRPLHQAFLSIQIDSPSRERVEALADLDTQVWQFEWQPYNALVWCREPWPQSIRRIDNQAKDADYSALGLLKGWIAGSDPRWRQARLILNPAEMASLWHLPHEEFAAPGIIWAPARRVAAPAQVIRQDEGVVLGENRYAGRTHRIRLSDTDRQTHVYIIGETGTGKSTLMHRMIHQDIAAGKGVGLIDPHGDLVRDILQTSIPKEREDDVIVFDFANTEHPPPLNPLAIPEGAPRIEAINHVMGVLKKIYADEWSKTRMENALYSALVALLHEEQATPRDIARLFLDAKYRKRLLEKVDDPVAWEYWHDEYNKRSDGAKRQVSEPVLNRIRAFYRNEAMRHMVCHPHRLDFGAMMDAGKIFLANLNSVETRSELNNLGTILMTHFQLAALSRHTAAGRRPFYLYVDEVQQFVTMALPEVLAGARKFGLSLTAANQHLGQLNKATLDALTSTVGTMVMFGIGPDDARALEPFVRPAFTVDDLVNFDWFHTAVKMKTAGKNAPAFSMHTIGPPQAPDDAAERAASIRQKSIANYTPWRKAEIAAWLEDRYPRRTDDDPPDDTDESRDTDPDDGREAPGDDTQYYD